MRLAISVFFAALPLSGGFAKAFFYLTALNALACALVALARRQRIDRFAMTDWDEALAMAFLCLADHVFFV